MSHADATQPVRPGDVLSVLIIVPAVAWVWVSFAEPVRFSTATLVGIAAAGAAVFGIPAWFWAADHVWTRLRGRLALGGAAGLGPPIAVLLSATLGVLWRDGAGDLEALFAQGAPIPGYGLLPWPVFAAFSAQCWCIGAVSGAIQWAIVRRRGVRSAGAALTGPLAEGVMGWDTVAAMNARATVAAIAIAAACIVTVDHEALGHGSACLALGGSITLLTSVYFHCTVPSAWIAAAGPLANLIMSAAAWLVLRAVPRRLSRLRLLLVLMTAFGVFWEAGYLLYSTVLGEGDWAVAARSLLGSSTWRWESVTGGLGFVLYVVGTRLTARSLRLALGQDGSPRSTDFRGLLRTSWAAASLSACVAAAAYAPDRIHAVRQALLEIGAASLPMLMLAARIQPGPPPPGHEGHQALGWILASAIGYVAFVETLGRGLY